MGRAPCCDKANVKKGPWSPEEDTKLKAYIEQYGTGGNWIALPQKIGLRRCGKSCRLRWLNYLRPNIKHGGFSEEEDNIICSLYISIGSRWSIIAAQLPGRTDNDIKNYWNTRLKKKLLGKQRKEQAARRARGSLKQEIKKDTDSFRFPEAINPQASYWPELPAILPEINQNEQNSLMVQESIKNLLIKLGGRFSDDNEGPSIISTTASYPLGSSCSQDQVHANSLNMMMFSSEQINSIDSADSQFPETTYNVNGAGPHTFQGLECFQAPMDELVYGNPQHLEASDNFYGVDIASSSSGTSSLESTDWRNINTISYPRLVPDFEPTLQSMPRESFLEDLRYLGAH